MPDVPVKNAKDAASARAAAQRVVETHRRLAAFLRPGQTLGQIDSFVAKTLEDLACRSCFHGYQVKGHPRFPSHACLSVNECIVHGTAGYYAPPLKAGDVLKIDIGVFYEGWVGDAAWTYVFGEPTPLVARLVRSGKEALARGVQELKPGAPYRRWAEVVQQCVETEHGFKCIRNWGGHGYNGGSPPRRALHGPPHILNHLPGRGESWEEMDHRWVPGVCVAVEPMIAVATGATFQRQIGKLRDWPVFVGSEGNREGLTPEQRQSVHYEHDVLIGEHGPIILTEGLEHTPDVIV